jgi:hypothetical protein
MITALSRLVAVEVTRWEFRVFEVVRLVTWAAALNSNIEVISR